MAIREVIQGVEYDGLLGGPEFPTLTKNVTVLSGTTLKRGAVVSKNTDGKYIAVTAELGPAGIVADDVDASKGDTVGTIYISGRFNRENLIVPSEFKIAGNEDKFEAANLYLTSIHA
ncbi:head decoration protein [Veillonella caviae]|uniref:head decoration protein n=1 Tax=Veillonella caviae TaxID=248316 RepID=UPI000F8CEB9D|nr:head decoration protein [Veillonella caviae]